MSRRRGSVKSPGELCAAFVEDWTPEVGMVVWVAKDESTFNQKQGGLARVRKINDDMRLTLQPQYINNVQMNA